MPNFNLEEEEIKTDLDRWMYVLRNMSKMEKIPVILHKKIFQKLFDIAEVASLKKEEYMLYEKALLDKWTEYAVKKTAAEKMKTAEDEAKAAREEVKEAAKKVKAATEKVKTAEEKARTAEEKAKTAEENAKTAEEQAKSAEKKIKKAIKESMETGLTEGAGQKSREVIKNLLSNTDFGTAKIAALANVTEAFVRKVKAEK